MNRLKIYMLKQHFKLKIKQINKLNVILVLHV